MMQTETTNAGTGANPVQEFSLRNVFLKNISIDAPRFEDYPKNLLWSEPEEVEFRANTKAWCFLANLYALELCLQVVVSQNGTTALSMTLSQMGTFEVTGYTEEQAIALLRTKGVEAVYPYARELVHSLASRSGIQQVRLPPLTLEGAGAQGEAPGSGSWAEWLTHRD